MREKEEKARKRLKEISEKLDLLSLVKIWENQFKKQTKLKTSFQELY